MITTKNILDILTGAGLGTREKNILYSLGDIRSGLLTGKKDGSRIKI